MPWHYLYRLADGALVSESDAPIDAPGGHAVRTHDDRKAQGAFRWDPAQSDFVAAAPARLVTPIGFLDRFTTAERIGIRAAAKTDAVAQDYLHRLDLKAACGEMIDLDSANTIGGLAYLEAAGVLAPGRKDAIRG